MSDAYFKFLREHNYDYDLAQRTMARTVGKMDPQERNQTILQALIGASTPKGFRNDRWLFGDFRQEGQQEPTMRDYTFEALMSVGHLQEPVFGVLPQSNSETMVTLAVDDAWAQFVRQNYVGADLKNPELKSEAEARFARQAQYLKSRSVQIANQRVLDDRGNVLGTVGDIHKGELYGLTGGLIANSQVRYNRLFLSLFDPAFTPQPEIDQEKSSQFHLDPYGAALSGMDPSGLPAYQRRTLEFLNQYIDTRNSDPFYEMSRTVASDLDTYANWMVEGWEAPENVHPTVFNALVKRATALAKEQGRGFQPPSLRSEVNAPAPVALPAPEMNERLTQRQGYIAGMPRSQFAARAANYVTARYVEGGKASEADLGNVWRWNYYAITKNPEWKLGDPLFQLEGRRQKAVDTSPKLPDFIREKGEASDLALVRGAMQNPERWKMVFPENANPPKATAERHLFRAPRSVSQERIDASNNARAWEEIFGRYGVVTQQLTRGMTEGEIESLGEPVDNDFGQLAVGSRDVNSRLFGVRGTYDVGSDEIYVDRSNLYTLKNSLRLAQSLKSRGGWQDRYLSSPSQDILSMISYDRGVYYHELGHRVHTQMPDVFDRFSGAIEKQRDVLKGISGRYASGRFLSSSDNRLEVIPEEEFAHQYALSRVSPEIQQMYYPAFGEFFQNERANIDRFLAENPASAYLVDTTGGPVPIRNLSSRSSNRLLSSSAQNKRYLFEAPNGSPRPPDNFPPESNRVPRGVFSSNEDGPQPFQFSDAYEGQYADADTLWEEAQRGNPNAIGALPEDMRSNSQERIASGGNVPRGWKLHFTTDDPESLSAYLSQRGYSHKVGRNSGQTGKDVTAYIGGLDDALEAAADIGVGARDLLKQPEGNVLSDDLPLLPNVMGRFDPRDQEFAQYGAKGYPHLRGDVINVLYGGMTREQADERAKARLTEKYGTLFTGEPLGSGQTPLDTIISESQERIASGGGVGGPPEEPPIAEDQFYEPEDEPPDGGRRSPHTERPAMEGKAREAISRGESFILNVATGGGKTGVMGAAMDEAFDRMGGGLSIAVSPLTKINEKNAVAFDEEQRRRLGIDPQTGEDIMGPQVGFFLPGHPGEGAPPEKLEAYNAAHKAVYDALGIEFDPRRGMTISGKGRIKKVGEGFEWQGDPMILTMSIEKLAASPKTRMGKVLQFLGKNQMLGMLNVDEAHGLLSDSRYMGRYLRDTWEGYAPGRPVGMVSGSLTPESRDTLRRAWNVDPRNVSVFPATEANRVSYIGAEVGSSYTDDPEAAKALAGFLEGDQPAFLFTDRIERMRDIEKQVKARGSKPFVIHSGQKGDLTPEEIELGNQKIREGLEPGDVAVASGVVGTGVHRPEVGQGAMYNPYDMETLIQGLGRVRSPEGDQPDRRRGIFATPGTYFYRAGEISKTGQRLEDMSYMAGLYTHLRSNEARYNKNWQVAAGEMSSRVGARLKEDKLSPGLSQNVIEYLHEAGLITLDSVTDGESSYFGFAFAERGDVSRVAQRLSEAQLKSRSQIDTDTGDYRKVSVADRVREDADLKSREQQAMGRLFHQAFRNTSSPEDAGKVIQQAAITYQNEGLKGLERLVDVDLPRDLAKRFVENLTAATENLGRLAKEGGSVADALTDTDQSIKRTREQTIGGNPKATRFAAGMLLNEAAAAYQRGNDYAGDTYRNEAEFLNRSANEGVPGGVPAFDESGRGGGKKQG
ncbi:MAG TPA: hypothetical protein PKD55_17225, partial [Bellilinea sp.]|nr:hypothetical protein [Bellilinea sp.]